MKNKLLIILLVVLALISLSAVSAGENATDAVSEIDDNAGLEEVPTDNGDLSQSDDVSGDIVADEETPSSNGADGNSSSNGTEEVVKAPSKITSSKATGYEKFKTKVTVKLTSNGKALASKPVKITINKVTYKRTTDSNGKVTLNLNLKKGTYTAKFSFAGDNNTEKSNGTSSVVVKSPTSTKLKIGDKYLNYR